MLKLSKKKALNVTPDREADQYSSPKDNPHLQQHS
jgi:hypothetical protein